jgi:hypothetical protein
VGYRVLLPTARATLLVRRRPVVSIDLKLNGNGAWPDLPAKLQEGKLEYHIDGGRSPACRPRSQGRRQ